MHPFQVMAEPVRRRVVEILSSGEHSAGEIHEAVGQEFGITASAVSKHLAILRENQWVIVRAEWANRLYRLDPDGLWSLWYEVDWLKYLWARRTGVMAGITPELKHAFPFVPRPYPRARTGTTRGLRGEGRRENREARHQRSIEIEEKLRRGRANRWNRGGEPEQG